MQPRLSIQTVTVISLYLMVVAASMAAIDCADWNSEEYFKAATAADVTDCLRSGADLKAAKDRESLKASDAYWRLNDARF